MGHALPLRLFLASPGDVVSERDIVRNCVAEHNARADGETDATYEVVEWERVRGSARRPQEAINELIAESHFLAVLFKGSWGSEPGSPWGFTSGTEEELFTGLLELGASERPMRDVWLAFLPSPSPASQIVDLRNQLANRHSMMFETIIDATDLKAKLTDRLQTWSDLAGSKVARHIHLLPSSGKDVLRASRLRLQGEKLVELGQPDAGRTALQEAAVSGGPPEHLAYARFLARHGDFDHALTETQHAIDYFADGDTSLNTTLAAEAFAAQAGVLRRQGRDFEAASRLEQALTLLDEGDSYANKVKCRILDDLGLARQKIGDLNGARQAFQKSLESRTESSEDLDICQSRINLARLAVRESDLETAAMYVEEVTVALRGAPPTALHANAQLLAAQVYLRQDRPNDGIPSAERAVSLNRQIDNRRGEAMSLLVLAQCHRSAGNLEIARAHAQECLALNESMGNSDGSERARWLLMQLQ